MEVGKKELDNDNFTAYFINYKVVIFQIVIIENLLEEATEIHAASSNNYQVFKNLWKQIENVRLERSLSSCESGSWVSGFISDDQADDITQCCIVILACNLRFIL